MPQIVLTEEQSKGVPHPFERVEIRSPDGRVLGYIEPVWSKEDIAKSKEIATTNKTWYTTEQVLEYLRSLEQTETALRLLGLRQHLSNAGAKE